MNRIWSSRRSRYSRSQRLLHLHDHLGHGEDLVRRRGDAGTGDAVGLVVDADAGAGAGLHRHLMPVHDQFAHAGGHQAHPILVRLDLLGHADQHPFNPRSTVLAAHWKPRRSGLFLDPIGCRRHVGRRRQEEQMRHPRRWGRTCRALLLGILLLGAVPRVAAAAALDQLPGAWAEQPGAALGDGVGRGRGRLYRLLDPARRPATTVHFTPTGRPGVYGGQAKAGWSIMDSMFGDDTPVNPLQEGDLFWARTRRRHGLSLPPGDRRRRRVRARPLCLPAAGRGAGHVAAAPHPRGHDRAEPSSSW